MRLPPLNKNKNRNMSSTHYEEPQLLNSLTVLSAQAKCCPLPCRRTTKCLRYSSKYLY